MPHGQDTPGTCAKSTTWYAFRVLSVAGIVKLLAGGCRASFTPGGPSQAELVARPHRHAVLEHNLVHLLAADLAALFVLQGGNDLLRPRVDDLARRGVGVTAVQAEHHPARLLAQSDAHYLPR